MKFDGYQCEQLSPATNCGFVPAMATTGNGSSAAAPAIAKLTKGTALIAGEICAIDEQGRSNFTLLKNALDGRTPEGPSRVFLQESEGAVDGNL